MAATEMFITEGGNQCFNGGEVSYPFIYSFCPDDFMQDINEGKNNKINYTRPMENKDVYIVA